MKERKKEKEKKKKERKKEKKKENADVFVGPLFLLTVKVTQSSVHKLFLHSKVYVDKTKI